MKHLVQSEAIKIIKKEGLYINISDKDILEVNNDNDTKFIRSIGITKHKPFSVLYSAKEVYDAIDSLLKHYIVYGDYSVERLCCECFRNDMKILGFLKARNINHAKEILIEDCFIDDINDIEENKVWVIEYKNETKQVFDLEDL